jgi:hypothetical protein
MNRSMDRLNYYRKWAYIDKIGNVLFTTSYALAWNFSDGLAQVQLGGIAPQYSQDAKYGYIDRTGKSSLATHQPITVNESFSHLAFSALQ